MTDRAPRGVLRVGAVRGVPVFVAPSWLAICLVLTLVYGPVIRGASGVGDGTAYTSAFGFALVFAACILAHEIGHTLVSLALRHPVRRVILFALGGMSEMVDEPDRARDELLIAAAGPLVSLLIAGAGWAGTRAVDTDGLPGTLLYLLFWSNLLIAAFNLLPGLPLDGGRLLRAALTGFGASAPAATVVAAWAGRAVAIAVALSGLLVERTALGLAAGVISIGLAAYLWFGAGVAVRTARLRARLPEVEVHDLMRSGLFVPSDVSVAEALRRAWDRDVRGIVLTDMHDRPAAIVDETLIGRVPPDRRAWIPVTDVARALEDGLMVPEGLDATTLLARMRALPANEYLVVRPDGTPAGIIATRDFARSLNGSPAGSPG